MLFDMIFQSQALEGISLSSSVEIDEINTLQAIFPAMQRALEQISRQKNNRQEKH